MSKGFERIPFPNRISIHNLPHNYCLWFPNHGQYWTHFAAVMIFVCLKTSLQLASTRSFQAVHFRYLPNSFTLFSCSTMELITQSDFALCIKDVQSSDSRGSHVTKFSLIAEHNATQYCNKITPQLSIGLNQELSTIHLSQITVNERSLVFSSRKSFSDSF